MARKSKAAPAQAEQPKDEVVVEKNESQISDDGVFRPKSVEELFAHDRAAAKAAQEASTPVQPLEQKQEVAEAPEPEQPEQSEPENAPDPSLEEVLKKLGAEPSRVRTRVKIDGEEREVTIEDLIRGYQTDQALSRRGNKIGEERRELERIKRELQSEISQRTNGKPNPSVSDAEIAPTNDPYIQQLQYEIAEMRAIRSQLEPMLYDRNREAVAEELRAEGFSDFKEYIPKISTYVATVEDPRQFEYYNTPDGAKDLYFRFKTQDAMKQASAPPAPVAPQKPALERPRPPIVKIPDASAPGTGVVDDYNEKYSSAMKEYQRTGNREALRELMRLKNLSSV